MKKTFKDIAASRTAQQTVVLYIAQLLMLAFGAASNIINARLLTTEAFGNYSFLIGFITVTSLFFEFGYFTAGSRLLALVKNPAEESRTIGALLLLGLIISLTFSLVIFFSGFVVDSMFNTAVGPLLIFFALPIAAYPFQFLLQLIYQGNNNITMLSLYTVIPRLLYTLGLVAVMLTGTLTLPLSFAFQTGSLVLSTLAVLVATKPAFSDLRGILRKIHQEMKHYGFQVYIGRVAGMAAFNSDPLLISYFRNTVEVGYFSLVQFFTTPISLLSRSLSTSAFKDFAHAKEISKRIHLYNAGWIVFCFAGYLLLGKFVLTLLFSDKYLDAVPLILPLAFATGINGFTQPYNFYLSAKGEGKYLQNTAITLFLSTLVSKLILVPLWGAMGAAYGNVIALTMNHLAHVYYYRKTQTTITSIP